MKKSEYGITNALKVSKERGHVAEGWKEKAEELRLS